MMASFGSLWDNRRKDKQTKSNPFVVVNWPALLVLFIPFCFVNSPRSLSLPTGSFKHQLLFLSSLSLFRETENGINVGEKIQKSFSCCHSLLNDWLVYFNSDSSRNRIWERRNVIFFHDDATKRKLNAWYSSVEFNHELFFCLPPPFRTLSLLR